MTTEELVALARAAYETGPCEPIRGTFMRGWLCCGLTAACFQADRDGFKSKCGTISAPTIVRNWMAEQGFSEAFTQGFLVGFDAPYSQEMKYEGEWNAGFNAGNKLSQEVFKQCTTTA